MKYLIVFLCLFFGLNVQAATTEGVSYDPLTRVVKQDDLKEQFANIRVTSTITNDSLSANTVVFSSSAKALGSIAPGNSGDVLTSAGAGVAPSFNPASGLNNWKDSGTTNSTLAGIGYPYGLVVTNTVEVGQSGEAGGIGIQNSSNVVVLTLTNISGLGALVFGPGTTNVLYRSGSDLVYTNGDSIPLFKVVNGSGANATMGLNAGGSAVLNSSSGAIYFDSRVVTKGIGPLTHNLYTIGSAGTAYSDIHSISNVVHSKFDAGGTNYSLLNMYHTGTNGNVVFDSEGSGTAGGAREFIFSSNGTTRAQITFTQTNRDAFISDGSKMILQKPNLFMADDGYEYLVRSPVGDTSGNLKRIFMATGTDTDLNAGAKSQIYLLTESPDANTKQSYFMQEVLNNAVTDSLMMSSDMQFSSGNPIYRWLIYNFGVGNLVEFNPTNFTYSTLSTINNQSNIVVFQNNQTDKVRVKGNGALTLSGTTNQLSMSSSQLLFNGTAVASSGSGGNVFNTGTPAVGHIPQYTDTTGTNIAPASANTIMWDGSQASRTWTANLSGTDPVWTYSSGVANLSTGALQVGGVAVSTATGANPSASVALSAVNGSAATFMRSDGAPALDQSIAPTWTGAHTFAASSGVPLTVTPAANTPGITISGFSTTSPNSTNFMNITGTWNTTNVNPGGLFINITNTASGGVTGNGADAWLIKAQTSGVDKWTLSKDGRMYLGLQSDVTGIYSRSQGRVTFFKTGSGDFFECSSTGWTLWSSMGYNFYDTDSVASGAIDLRLQRGAAATLQLGADATTPVNQAIKAHDATSASTNIAGANLTLEGGQSTGTGKGGAFITMTTPSGATGTSYNSYSTRSYESAQHVVLTESSATLFANISLASSKYLGARLICTINADDATDFQSLTSEVSVDAVNKGGTVTASLTQVDNTTAASAGTLTCTYTAVANGNGVDIKANAVSSLTQTTLNCRWIIVALNSDGVATVTPQ